MIDIESLRDALTAIADEAPSARDIRAGLADRQRVHRQRRLLLRVAGAGVVAATVTVAGLGVRRLLVPGDGFPTIAGGPGGGWLRVPLRYHPAWVPGGFGLSTISVLVVGERAEVTSRQWELPGSGRDGVTSIIGLTVGWHESLDPNRPIGRTETVAVNGVAGQLVHTDQASTYLTWQPSGGPQLIVTVIGDDIGDERAVALRVARSVRPDGRDTWVGPRFGWLPSDLSAAPQRFTLSHGEVTWSESLVLNGAGNRQLDVWIGPDVIDPGLNRDSAVPVTVRGSSGWLVDAEHRLMVNLSDGTEVMIHLDGAAGTDLTRIAEQLDIGPWPDMSWVGSR